MKQRTRNILIGSTAILASIGSAYADDAAARALAPPAQNVDQAQVLATQKARGEFGTGASILQIGADRFVNEISGAALRYVASGYYHRPATETDAVYQASFTLPQGAALCWLNLYAYDNDATAAISVSIKEFSGYGDDATPTITYRESVTSSDATTSHYGYTSTFTECRTINNDVRYGGGAQYTLELTMPTIATATNLRIKAVDLWWFRHIAPAPTTATFTDVPTSHWAYQSVEALRASGVTTGTSPTTFNPTGTVSRAEMAVFLSRALGLGWPY